MFSMDYKILFDIYLFTKHHMLRSDLEELKLFSGFILYTFHTVKRKHIGIMSVFVTNTDVTIYTIRNAAHIFFVLFCVNNRILHYIHYKNLFLKKYNACFFNL